MEKNEFFYSLLDGDSCTKVISPIDGDVTTMRNKIISIDNNEFCNSKLDGCRCTRDAYYKQIDLLVTRWQHLYIEDFSQDTTQ